jgi:hypothetical protein
VSSSELAITALRDVKKVNSEINAVLEAHLERMESDSTSRRL